MEPLPLRFAQGAPDLDPVGPVIEIQPPAPAHPVQEEPFQLGAAHLQRLRPPEHWPPTQTFLGDRRYPAGIMLKSIHPELHTFGTHRPQCGQEHPNHHRAAYGPAAQPGSYEEMSPLGAAVEQLGHEGVRSNDLSHGPKTEPNSHADRVVVLPASVVRQRPPERDAVGVFANLDHASRGLVWDRSHRSYSAKERLAAVVGAATPPDQGFAFLKVIRMYPEPAFAWNSAGRALSGSGALSHVVSVSPSKE